MRRNRFRILAWLLMLCLIVGFLPMQPARAASDTSSAEVISPKAEKEAVSALIPTI